MLPPLYGRGPAWPALLVRVLNLARRQRVRVAWWRLAKVAVLVCAVLDGTVLPAPSTVVVYGVVPPTRYGWEVAWELRGIPVASFHETKADADRLYAVLARAMIDRRVIR